MTVEQIAKKYGMTLAKDVALSKIIEELLMRVESLEIEMAMLMGHQKEEEAESFTKDLIKTIKED